jgi:hypothetical protein
MECHASAAFEVTFNKLPHACLHATPLLPWHDIQQGLSTGDVYGLQSWPVL